MGQPPCDAFLRLDRAAALARIFVPDDEEHAFALAHYRASVVLCHGTSATKALAELLLTASAVPGNVVMGIVTSELGSKLLALRSGLFAG